MLEVINSTKADNGSSATAVHMNFDRPIIAIVTDGSNEFGGPALLSPRQAQEFARAILNVANEYVIGGAGE